MADNSSWLFGWEPSWTVPEGGGPPFPSTVCLVAGVKNEHPRGTRDQRVAVCDLTLEVLHHQ